MHVVRTAFALQIESLIYVWNATLNACRDKDRYQVPT